MDTYCKIFLSVDEDKTKLFNNILSVIPVTQSGIRSFKNPFLEGALIKNDDFDLEKSSNLEDGFLYYPYYIDLDTESGFNQVYLDQIIALMRYFKQQSISAVAACDFEEELKTALSDS